MLNWGRIAKYAVVMFVVQCVIGLIVGFFTPELSGSVRMHWLGTHGPAILVLLEWLVLVCALLVGTGIGRKFLCLALACVAMGGCTSVRPDGTALTGSAGFACDIDDGPATLAHLQANGAGVTWIFNVHGQSPDGLDGEYPINASGRRGSASLRICNDAMDCTAAVEGTVVVTRQHRRRLEGWLAYRLPSQASQRRAFVADIDMADRATCP